MDPNTTALAPTEYYAVYDPLTRLDITGTVIEPALAESWEAAGSDWIFSLREAEWSDGTEFTADDVKFSFEYYANPDNASRLISRVNTQESVTVVDPRTVRIRATGTDPIMPRRATLPLRPPEARLRGAGRNTDRLLGGAGDESRRHGLVRCDQHRAGPVDRVRGERVVVAGQPRIHGGKAQHHRGVHDARRRLRVRRPRLGAARAGDRRRPRPGTRQYRDGGAALPGCAALGLRQPPRRGWPDQRRTGAPRPDLRHRLGADHRRGVPGARAARDRPDPERGRLRL